MHLFHQTARLRGIYASKQSCIVVHSVRDFTTQEELACHALDELLLTACGPKHVFTIFDISLDIMVPWRPIDFSFDTHAFFDIHAVGWHAVDLYTQLSHVISFCQLNHASQGG